LPIQAEKVEAVLARAADRGPEIGVRPRSGAAADT
jgi:hypothetical protein